MTRTQATISYLEAMRGAWHTYEVAKEQEEA